MFARVDASDTTPTCSSTVCIAKAWLSSSARDGSVLSQAGGLRVGTGTGAEVKGALTLKKHSKNKDKHLRQIYIWKYYPFCELSLQFTLINEAH